MSAHPHLESALPGFSEAREIIKGAGDSVFPLQDIYVHGHLTAHPNKCEAGNVETICDQLSDFILDLIRDDFSRRLNVARGAQ